VEHVQHPLRLLPALAGLIPNPFAPSANTLNGSAALSPSCAAWPSSSLMRRMVSLLTFSRHSSASRSAATSKENSSPPKGQHPPRRRRGHAGAQPRPGIQRRIVRMALAAGIVTPTHFHFADHRQQGLFRATLEVGRRAAGTRPTIGGVFFSASSWALASRPKVRRICSKPFSRTACSSTAIPWPCGAFFITVISSR